MDNDRSSMKINRREEIRDWRVESNGFFQRWKTLQLLTTNNYAWLPCLRLVHYVNSDGESKETKLDPRRYAVPKPSNDMLT